MNVEELLELERKDAIRAANIDSTKNTILVCRDCGFDDEKIYSVMKKRFTKHFTPEELRKLIKETK